MHYRKRYLSSGLFKFVKAFSDKVKHICVYNTVRKTNKYDKHTFMLDGKEVKPIVYSGIWIDPDSECDHCIRGADFDFWYTYDARVFIIAEVDKKFYIPKIDFTEGLWTESHHELEELSIDIASERRLVPEYFSDYDTFLEQTFEDVIQLTNLEDETHDKKLTFGDLIECIAD